MRGPKSRHTPSAALVAAAAVVGITAAAGTAANSEGKEARSTAALARLKPGKPEDLGRPIRSVTLLSAQVTREDGKPVLVGMTGGNLPYINVVDLQSNTLLRSFPAPGAASCWGGTVLPDGTVYLLSFKKLYRYDPRQKKVEDLGVPIAGEGAFWTLNHDEDGNLYGGSYPNGKVFRYEPRTKKYTVLGETGQPYARSTAYHNGIVYAGTGPTTPAKIVAFDTRSGAKKELPLPDLAEGDPNWVYGLDVRGGRYLFAYFTFPNKNSTLRLYDLNKQQWCPEAFPGYNDLYVGPERDGKTYFHWNGYWQEMDLDTRKVRPLAAKAGATYRGGGWAELGNPARPVIATAGFGGGIILTDVTTGEQTGQPVVMKSDASDLQAMTMGDRGRLFLSGYLTNQAGVLDTATGQTTLFPMGQGEGIAVRGDKAWYGVYSGAYIFEVDVTAPFQTKQNPREIYHIPDEQDRPFGMAVTDSWLVAGTIPSYGRLGGSLSVLDRRSGKWQSYRNVISNQSIVSVTIQGDIVYGSTGIYGGLGGDPSEPEGKVFSWDLRTGRKIAETTLKFPGQKPPRFVGGVTLGPDGLLWGVADGSIFALDPKTLTVKKQRTLYPDVADYSRFRPSYLGFGKDGLIYSCLAGRLTAIDPQILDFRSLGIKADLMALGADGSLYYRQVGEGARVMRLRLEQGK